MSIQSDAGLPPSALSDRFRLSVHEFCAALHLEHCNPGEVEILLPHDQWWRLQCSIDRKFRGFMYYDGRRPFDVNYFIYLGLTFRFKETKNGGQ